LKIAEKTAEVTSNIVYDESVAVGIEESAVPMVIERLISTYKNPYRAALREYTSNAYDEHIQAGVKVPVEVNLPNTLSPVLTVQDFGRGLTREELKGFGTIGRSTKRDSNETTGGFGMGSKCALAAAAQFTVVSVKDGKRNTVIVARDERNIPHMNFLAEAETTDHSGTKVIIPISEVEKFGDLSDFWIGWKPGTILVDDEEPRRTVFNPKQFRQIGNGLAYNDLSNTASSRDRVRVLINQVYYELDYNMTELTYKQQQLLKYNVIRLDNGSVDIGPSREDLLYNARTKAALRARFDEVLSLSARRERASISSQSSLREALLARNRMNNDGYNVVGLRWNGTPLVLPGETYCGNRVKDPMGTWASPLRDRNTRSGYKVEKNYRTLSHVEIWRSNYRFVLVHGVGAPTTYGQTGRLAHRESHSVGEWLSEQANSYDYSWKFFFTDEPINRINRAYREMADVILTADEYNATVSKARAARALANKAELAAKQASTQLQVVYGSYYGVPSIREWTPSEISAHYDYTIILRNQASGLAGQIRDAMTTKKNYDQNTVNAATYVMQQRKVALILAGKNEDLSEILPLLPKQTTFRDLVVDIIKSADVKKTVYERMAVRDRSKYGLTAVNSIRDNWIDKVKRRETAEWLRAIRDFKDEGSTMVSRLTWFSQRDTEVAEAMKSVTGGPANLPPSPLLRYPLLQSFSYSKPRDEDIVDYMNLRDKALKKG